MANHWPGYEVRFPEHDRRLPTGYGRISSPDLDAAREAVLPGATFHGAEVAAVSGDEARLTDGERFHAPLILDARGASASPHLQLAWQKFVGLEVRLDRPHGVERPLIMDARVHQADGFRFFYVLPLDERRLLVEDTRYSDGPALPVADLTTEVRRYARARRWRIVEEVQRETGVLPIVLGGDFDAYWRQLDGTTAPLGMRALLFHPTTGYSLPDAARMADRIAGLPELTTAAARRLVATRAKEIWRRGGYLRLLNRMLFRAASPERRYAVLERFYRLPQPLIERFYANRLTLADQARVLSGRPPVPVRAALSAIRLQSREVALG